jgi:hypothetical protein
MHWIDSSFFCQCIATKDELERQRAHRWENYSCSSCGDIVEEIWWFWSMRNTAFLYKNITKRKKKTTLHAVSIKRTFADDRKHHCLLFPCQDAMIALIVAVFLWKQLAIIDVPSLTIIGNVSVHDHVTWEENEYHSTIETSQVDCCLDVELISHHSIIATQTKLPFYKQHRMVSYTFDTTYLGTSC